MKAVAVTIFGVLTTLLTVSAHASLHCSEVGEAAVQQKVQEILQRKGVDVSVQTIIGDYQNSSNFVVLAGLGTDGAVAFKVKTHIEDETQCVVDSVTETQFVVNQSLK